jgi:hypothetical protein
MKGGNVSEPCSWPRPATPCDLVPAWAGEFRDFGDWVNFATKRLTGAIGSCGQDVAPIAIGSCGQDVAPICVDTLGRRCAIGADFLRARDEETFPVRYFWECRPAAPPAAEAQAA